MLSPNSAHGGIRNATHDQQSISVGRKAHSHAGCVIHIRLSYADENTPHRLSNTRDVGHTAQILHDL